MKQLDKFIKEITVLEYQLGGKIIKGDVSAYNLLQLQTLNIKDLSEAEQMEKTFTIIFGKEDATLMLKTLTLEAIVDIVNDISKEFGNDSTPAKKG